MNRFGWATSSLSAARRNTRNTITMQLSKSYLNLPWDYIQVCSCTGLVSETMTVCEVIEWLRLLRQLHLVNMAPIDLQDPDPFLKSPDNWPRPKITLCA